MLLESREVSNLTHLCPVSSVLHCSVLSDLGSVSGSQHSQCTESPDDGQWPALQRSAVGSRFFPTHTDSPTQRAFTDSCGQNRLRLFSPFECTDPLFTKALLAQEQSAEHAHSREGAEPSADAASRRRLFTH